ncbi:MAG: pilin [Patescibacteria group bacterium]|nr:pilin [Patescibacteria group bacterium]
MDCLATEVPTDLGCIPTDPVKFVSKFYGMGLGLIGGVSLLFIIYGGYLIMTSRGNPSQLNEGKSFIFYAIIGLVLAIFGFAFIQLLAADILQIPGFK